MESLRRLAGIGVGLGYVTNNASRSPAQVAQHLRELGAPAEDDQVVSSSQAAAELLASLLPAGARVLITGSAALAREIELVGLVPVRSAAEDPVAVVQGFSPEIGWKDLAEASYVVAGGALWVATNTDMSIPQARGIAPGNGTLVAAVAAATGQTPLVAGKPEAPLFHAAAKRLAADRPLVVGDRLDTDILGGNNAGFATAAVLTGVDTRESILAARTLERPDFIIRDLTDLYAPYPPWSTTTGGTAAVPPPPSCRAGRSASAAIPPTWIPGGPPVRPGGPRTPTPPRALAPASNGWITRLGHDRADTRSQTELNPETDPASCRPSSLQRQKPELGLAMRLQGAGSRR